MGVEGRIGNAAVRYRDVEPGGDPCPLGGCGQVTVDDRPGVDVVSGPRNAVVKGGRRSANHYELDLLHQRLVDGFEEPLELVLDERPHDGRANFSNMAL